MMKTVGIIGGIGPESTVEYYRLIIASYREQRTDGSYPALIINSIDLKRMLDLVAANELVAVTDYLVDGVNQLARAGADFGVLASNTPHIVFDEIRARSTIPLISMVETTAVAARAWAWNESVCSERGSPCRVGSIRTYFRSPILQSCCLKKTSKNTFMTSTWAS